MAIVLVAMSVRALLVLLAVILLPTLSARAQPAGPVVLAASSLQEALSDAADAWSRRGHPRPVLSFAASSALARQIEAGAPADLFLSADTTWMDHVEQKALIRAGTRKTVASNRLVLIAPGQATPTLRIAPGFALANALGAGRLAVADPDAVPAGRYAAAALKSLGVWTSVEGRLARAENVRAALALVERAEAPLGIVYATDARASGRVRVVDTFPATSHPPIVYPVAILTSATHPDAAAFHSFLLSAQGKAIFTARGFGK